MRSWKGILAISVALVAIICGFVFYARSQDPRTQKSSEYDVKSNFSADHLNTMKARFASVEESEAAWIETCVLPDGAIAFRPAAEGKNTVNQYFSIYSALAILAASPSSADFEIVRSHLEWSFSHMSADEPDEEGLLYTIGNFDETVSGGSVTSEVSTGYDAADSELALFLSEVWQYAQQTGDYSMLDDHADQVKGSMQTLLSLIEDDGLSYGKPSYHVAYLMDNCEVYQGLVYASAMMQSHYAAGNAASEDRQLASDISNAIIKMEDGFEDTLWDGGNGHYLAYAGESSFSWDTFYADASSQLFPAIFGVIDGGSMRSAAVYDQFCSRYDWTQMDYYTSGQTGFYWSVVALGAAHTGDLARLSAYLDTYSSLVAGGHAYPAYSGDAAMVVLACATGVESCETALGS